ncbi:HAD family hydrolase [Rhodobaculum claviforme]|uniref:phosphoglycolate phosphatase n=1 Tax=Rhodobaculum claviforme TaxID=1549854 RepID=A0A934TLS6_9RHOB|nr:HAD family hydrolase [Rhodobaculum claviforme]MBK5928165.1 HAD family hydrolase [Rhodobaculum claviforme]
MIAHGHYATLVFDCDGVVLDSNRLKTEAFRRAALPWGEAAADALVAYHIAHGGVSRYVKFRHFLDALVPEHAPGGCGPGLEGLLDAYAGAVRDGLMTCGVAPGLAELRAATPGVRWLIVSGGDQAELREVFAARGLDRHFDGGIFGSPDTKAAILARELAAGNIRRPALFLGDSRLDFEAAAGAGLDFTFVSGWSEVADWRGFVAEHRLACVAGLSDLLGGAGPA